MGILGLFKQRSVDNLATDIGSRVAPAGRLLDFPAATAAAETAIPLLLFMNWGVAAGDDRGGSADAAHRRPKKARRFPRAVNFVLSLQRRLMPPQRRS